MARGGDTLMISLTDQYNSILSVTQTIFFFLKNALGKLRQKGIVQMVKGDTSTAEIKNQHTNFLTIDNGMLIMPIVGPKTFFICDDFLNRNAVKQYHLDREFQKHYHHLLFWKFR